MITTAKLRRARDLRFELESPEVTGQTSQVRAFIVRARTMRQFREMLELDPPSREATADESAESPTAKIERIRKQVAIIINDETLIGSFTEDRKENKGPSRTGSSESSLPSLPSRPSVKSASAILDSLSVDELLQIWKAIVAYIHGLDPNDALAIDRILLGIKKSPLTARS